MIRKPLLASRWCDLLIVGFLILTFSLIAHLWIAERLAVSRAIYPLEAKITQWTTKCSPNAPVWMRPMIAQAVESLKSPANQLAYISPEGEMHHCENGWRDRPLLSHKVDRTSRFRFASITKVFTADAVLDLVNQGKLNLEARFVEYFPELPPPRDSRVADLTIHQLLSHSAGFDRMKSVDPMFVFREEPWCPYRLKEITRLQLDYTPGERQVYSNRGYCLLGQLIERVSGVPYRDYLETRYLLTANGLKFVDGPYLDDEVRYDFRSSDFYTAGYWRLFDFYALSSVAGLSGSAVGLATAVRKMVLREANTLLSASIPKHCELNKPQECYGYAFYMYRTMGKIAYVHEGYLPGASPILLADRSGAVLVLLSSGKSMDVEQKYAMVDLLSSGLSQRAQ